MSEEDIRSPKQDSHSSEEIESESLNKPLVDRLLRALTGDQFRDWYRERQYRKNIENGTPYFNGPASVSDPDRHSPSKLLKCHRQTYYKHYNAPEETGDPDGIFWFGTRFEEDIAFPFLERAVTGSNTYVRNSVWVDFQVEQNGIELQIKGETDPLIVDPDATPVLPTEIKTKSSIENTTSPNRSHRAQLHAYMAGLSEKYDKQLNEGVIIYGSRDTLDVKIFSVEFDKEFWEKIVLQWAAEQTNYRLDDELPPPEPEYEWECQFCPFRERCGQGNRKFSDMGAKGFLSGYSDYPREKVIQHLDSNSDANLTPALAEEFPELAESYSVSSLKCPKCTSFYDFDLFDTGTSTAESQPICPSCADDGSLIELRILEVSLSDDSDE